MATASCRAAAPARPKPVGYLVNHPGGLAGAHGIGFDYVLGAGGLYVQSESAHLTARVLVAPFEVRGLAPVTEKVEFAHGPIPAAAAQATLLMVTPVVLTVVIVMRIADQPHSLIVWGAFGALLVSGLTTILQAAGVGRFGSGHVLLMGTSGAFIAVCIAALTTAGPATMASLIVVSSLFQFLLAARLSVLRRIFTPVVTGTVIMLIAATVFPVVFNSLTDVPEGTHSAAAPLAAGITLAIVAGLVLRGPPKLRLWSPIIGIVVGTLVGAPFGMYEYKPILEAPWFGVPFSSWPGLDVTPDHKFWALLPAFIIVTLVGAIETIGDGVAIQRVSQRRQRATDFRVVQGALNADGAGNLLSGLAATLPNTTYSTSISLAEVTGIGSRRVGIIIGAMIATVAFFPKIAALGNCHTDAGGRRLHHGAFGPAVRAGHENSDPGWR